MQAGKSQSRGDRERVGVAGGFLEHHFDAAEARALHRRGAKEAPTRHLDQFIDHEAIALREPEPAEPALRPATRGARRIGVPTEHHALRKGVLGRLQRAVEFLDHEALAAARGIEPDPRARHRGCWPTRQQRCRHRRQRGIRAGGDVDAAVGRRRPARQAPLAQIGHRRPASVRHPLAQRVPAGFQLRATEAAVRAFLLGDDRRHQARCVEARRAERQRRAAIAAAQLPLVPGCDQFVAAGVQAQHRCGAEALRVGDLQQPQAREAVGGHPAHARIDVRGRGIRRWQRARVRGPAVVERTQTGRLVRRAHHLPQTEGGVGEVGEQEILVLDAAERLHLRQPATLRGRAQERRQRHAEALRDARGGAHRGVAAPAQFQLQRDVGEVHRPIERRIAGQQLATADPGAGGVVDHAQVEAGIPGPRAVGRRAQCVDAGDAAAEAPVLAHPQRDQSTHRAAHRVDRARATEACLERRQQPRVVLDRHVRTPAARAVAAGRDREALLQLQAHQRAEVGVVVDVEVVAVVDHHQRIARAPARRHARGDHRAALGGGAPGLLALLRHGGCGGGEQQGEQDGAGHREAVHSARDRRFGETRLRPRR